MKDSDTFNTYLLRNLLPRYVFEYGWGDSMSKRTSGERRTKALQDIACGFVPASVVSYVDFLSDYIVRLFSEL